MEVTIERKLYFDTLKDDLQTKRVYRSENVAFSDEQKLSEINLKIFFLEVVGDIAFRSKYGEGFEIFFCGKGVFNYSFAGYKEIYMLKNEHFTMSSVLHELAHAVKKMGKNPHGKAFCNRYISLVREYISQQKAEELKVQFKKNKVLF